MHSVICASEFGRRWDAGIHGAKRHIWWQIVGGGELGGRDVKAVELCGGGEGSGSLDEPETGACGYFGDSESDVAGISVGTCSDTRVQTVSECIVPEVALKVEPAGRKNFRERGAAHLIRDDEVKKIQGDGRCYRVLEM